MLMYQSGAHGNITIHILLTKLCQLVESISKYVNSDQHVVAMDMIEMCSK